MNTADKKGYSMKKILDYTGVAVILGTMLLIVAAGIYKIAEIILDFLA